jgi:hypothetical protein
MNDCASRQNNSSGDATMTEGASRRHLRLIQPPSPAVCSDEHAHELPTHGTNHDIYPDLPPPTVLAW